MDEASSLVTIIKLAEEENDCRGVVDAMREGSSSALVVKEGAKTITTMSLNGTAQTDIDFGRAGAVEILVRGLEEHGASDAGVARNGCGALKNLACGNVDNKKRIAEAGGIEMIVSVMKEHGASNAGVAKDGFGALRNLAVNNADNKKRIAEAGSIEMILSMMEVHGASNAGVAEYGCGALQSLATNNDNNKTLIGAGGILRILHVIEQHMVTSADVVMAGCAALGCLALNNALNMRIIPTFNGVNMVKLVRSTWQSHAGVQKQANLALEILPQYDEATWIAQLYLKFSKKN